MLLLDTASGESLLHCPCEQCGGGSPLFAQRASQNCTAPWTWARARVSGDRGRARVCSLGWRRARWLKLFARYNTPCGGGSLMHCHCERCNSGSPLFYLSHSITVPRLGHGRARAHGEAKHALGETRRHSNSDRASARFESRQRSRAG